MEKAAFWGSEQQAEKVPVHDDGLGVDLYESCMQAAEQLLHVLREEAEVLKHFKVQDLMGILPRKELLIEQVHTSVGLLAGGSGETGADPRRAALRKALEEIHRQNDSNRIFIEGSLSHWQDLIDIICPSGYGPGYDVSSGLKPCSMKGLALSKEV